MMLFVLSYTEIDAAELTAGGTSTAWQFAIGTAAGVVLIALALALGAVVQRRGAARDESRKAELRAAAEASGAVSFTELDLSDDADFDLGLPTSPGVAPVSSAVTVPEDGRITTPAPVAADIPEYL